MKATAQRAASRRGFALIITIVLVAFLVLILVGLATFTRVETQVADNSQQIAKARQNALMALNIAIGQLQKTTGPDQRVTATADIAAAATGGRLTSGATARNTASVNGTGNGLLPSGATASVQSGTRYWTGVWGRAGTSYATPGKSIYDETPSPVLLNWLVSGNEDRAFTMDASGLVQTSTADGRSATATAPFTPGAPINWAAAGLNPAAPNTWSGSSSYADLEIKSAGQKAVLLVGPKTAGVAVDVAGDAAVDRYVVAPLMDITLPAAQVPGMGTTGNVTVGRYAWWVGDEGVKASYTITDPFPGKNNPDASTAAGAEARLRLMSSARSGVDLLTGFGNYPDGDDASAANLANVLTMPQAAFMDANLATAAGRELLSANFHDLTPSSLGLLTNSQSGGLRKDLTYYFEQSPLPAPLAGTGIIPSPWSPDWGTGNLAPKWDWLYSFYNTNPGVSSPSLAVRPETSTEVGVTPIITQFRMLAFTDGGMVSNLNNITPAGTAFQLPVRCNVAFVLANPYNVTLTIPANAYEFVLNNTASASGYNPSVPTLPNEMPGGLVIGVTPTSHGYNESLGHHVLLRAENDTVNKSTLDTVRFTVPAVSIPPGETVTLSVDGSSTTAGGITPPSVGSEDAVPLVADDISTGHYFTSKATLDFTTLGTPPPAPAAGQPRTIALMYVHNQVFVTVTLRRVNNGAILQQWRDFAFSKTQETTGTGGDVFGNFHIKFMPPARRNMDSSGPANVFHYALFAEARPFADLNLRAKTLDHTAMDNPTGSLRLWTAPSYAGGINRNTYQSLKGGFTENLSPASWAEDFDTGMRTSAASKGVFFDFPRRDATNQPPVLSLGHLQHASLTADDWHANTSINYQPAYAVGNSYSTPFVTRGQAVQSRARGYYKAPTANVRYFDMSYLLNTALWDGYYFSGIPQSGTDLVPRNRRYELDASATPGTAQAAYSAAHLYVNGAFNVNSTSKAAWVALLSGLNERRVNDDSSSSGVPFPRTLWQAEDNAAASGTGDAAYAGYRRLTPAQIDLLATEIVKRVRARGPFVSLSHFVNRSLVAANGNYNPDVNDAEKGSGDLAVPGSVPMGRGFSGPLQAAIDSSASGLNLFPNIGPRLVAGKLEDRDGGNGDRLLFAGEMLSSSSQKPDNSNANPIYFADTRVDAPNLDPFIDSTGAAPGPQGRTSTGIPDWLLQGDVLQAIGPALSARSDTFVIRTYGEVVNPAIAGDKGAQVWCEAVVQRVPDYVKPTADAATAADYGALTDADNRLFGRKYKIVSFRWLGADDI